MSGAHTPACDYCKSRASLWCLRDDPRCTSLKKSRPSPAIEPSSDRDTGFSMPVDDETARGEWVVATHEKAIGFLTTTRQGAIALLDVLNPDRMSSREAVVDSLDRIVTACSHALATVSATTRNKMRPDELPLAPRCRNRKGQLSGARFVGKRLLDAICAFCKKPRSAHEFDEAVQS